MIICSAGRVGILNHETLRMLERGNLQSELHIVVPNEQLEEYRALIRTSLPYHLHGTQKGLTCQRQFARSLFPEDEELVFCDDDVQRLRELRGDRLFDVESIDEVLRYMFQTMREAEASLWSVYPVANRGWQSNKIQVGNTYCVGAFYGIRNDIPPEPLNDEKEDWARQLALQAAGKKVMRFCLWGIQTRYWKGDTGGIQRTWSLTDRIVNDLVTRYPTLVTRKQRRNGQIDLKFVGRSALWPFPQSPELSLPAPVVASQASPDSS